MIQQALEIDPYSPVITLNLAIVNLLLGHDDEALRQLKKCIELDPSFAPGHAWIGNFYEKKKNYSEALVQIQKAVELSGRSGEALGYLGYYYASVGNRAEALKLVKENEDRYRAGTGAAYIVARIYAGMGDKEKALEWLEVDYNDRSTWISSLLSDYAWDGLRSEPRFVELTKKVGLVK